MIYLFYGTKDYEINEEIKKITKNQNEININKYDLNNVTFKNILEDLETPSMFEGKKTIIADNANMFTTLTSKDSEDIEKYLNHINQDANLILIVHSEKLDTRKKITKLIKKVGIVKELNENVKRTNIVKQKLKDYNIEDKTIDLFLNRVGTNPLIIQNEIDKIKIYKNKDKNITDEDILNLTVKTVEIDIFKLIDYIVKKDKEKAIELYYEMLKMNEEPIKIIVILANQFRIMYQSKELFKKGYSEKDIAETLKIHPYRVKLALQNGRNYTAKTLLKYLNNLADIDIGIKTGKLNKDLALELFILK